jgi:uncharacterized membrane protein
VPCFLYYFILSPGSAKLTSTTHLTLNLVVVTLFAINLWILLAVNGDGGWTVGLSAVAVLLLAVAGWLGGELVYVHGSEEKPQAARPQRGRRRVA